MKLLNMKRIAALLGLTVLVGSGVAQDAHFSQYFMSPLYTNPAMTGQINGNFRLNSLFRSQWNAFGDAFTTASFSADARKNAFGLGVSVIDETAGINDFSRLNAVVSGSYDIAYNSGSNHHFVFGAQLGIINTSVNDENVTVPDQWLDGFGAVNPVNEDFSGLNNVAPEANFGFMWFNGSSRLRYTPFAGAAVFHLIPTQDSFEDSENLPMRFLVHGGIRYRTKSAVDVTPHLQASLQGDAYNVIGGVNVSYGLIDTRVRLEGGISYRVEDAVIPYLGVRWRDFQFGATYDANLSPLSEIGPRKNSVEFSLTYINQKNSYKEEYICPRL